MSNSWPLVRLSEVLRYRKEFVTIDDLVTYKRPRVQLHAQGIVLRDEIPGALIRTKKQQVCRVGEFLVAEIDAKVGGFGIVPDSLAGAIVSSHYFLFAIDESKLDRQFLDHFIRTFTFREQVEAQGSTNYSAIRPTDVLDYEIPLPSITEQRRIVARIGELVANIDESNLLRGFILNESNALVVSIHLTLSGTRTRKLGQILRLDEDSIAVVQNQSYPQVGIRSFGAGLFGKSAITSTETAYKGFNRLYEGAVVLSQVKGWEGAVAVCGPEFAGRYASPEYRTFRCDPDEVRPSYLAALVASEWFWSRLAQATRGVGARRERTRPEQFVAIEIPMPELEQQKVGEVVFTQLQASMRLQNEMAVELDALSSSILDRAFNREL